MPDKETKAKPNAWKTELETRALTNPSRVANLDQSPSCPPLPLAEPIELASVWEMESPESADAALANPSGNFVYRRDGHPNARSLSNTLASLHAGAEACVFAQGMSAFAAIAWAFCQPGDEVWIGDELYGKTNKLFSADLPRWGVQVKRFDITNSEHIKQLSLAQAPKLVLIETLTNPTVKLANIQAIREATSAQLVVDNTFATHLLCQPITLGADIVVESLSKQVNGHSDTMLGLAVCRSSEQYRALTDAMSTLGLTSSPFDCYLTSRGLKTLAVRLERACQNALALASALSQISLVSKVDYPGLTSHAQHELATAQLMGGYGWMLAVHTGLDSRGIGELFKKLEPEIPFAPSLGDCTTTVSHPATTSHRGYALAERKALGISDGTFRISVGIEPTDWLIEKFASALERCTA